MKEKLISDISDQDLWKYIRKTGRLSMKECELNCSGVGKNIQTTEKYDKHYKQFSMLIAEECRRTKNVPGHHKRVRFVFD